MKIDNIKHIDSSLRVVVQRAFSSIDHRRLFYDTLLFLSAMSKSTRHPGEEDINAFYEVIDYVKTINIPLWQYLSTANKMMENWKLEYLPIKYYLNEKVKKYVNDNYLTVSDSLMFSDLTHSHVGAEDRKVRSTMLVTESDYKTTLYSMAADKKLSELFCLWKAYVLPDKYGDLFKTGEEKETMKRMHNVLRPVFNYSLGKAGIYRLHPEFRWSHSKFETYDNCPVLFRDQYVLETVPYMQNEAAEAGSKAHFLFEEFVNRYNKSKTKKIATLYNNIKKTEQYKSVDPVHLDGFTKFCEVRAPELFNGATEILSEHTFAMIHNEMSISGIVDLIVIYGNTAHIIDYKTSKIDGAKLAKNNKKYAVQLSQYAEMLRKERPDITGDITCSIYYTRDGGVEVPVNIDTTILDKRSDDAVLIKESLWNSKVEPKTSHCFVCSHPTCSQRKTQSMWNSDGTRRIPEKSK